jgi:hypothetical protein
MVRHIPCRIVVNEAKQVAVERYCGVRRQILPDLVTPLEPIKASPSAPRPGRTQSSPSYTHCPNDSPSNFMATWRPTPRPPTRTVGADLKLA